MKTIVLAATVLAVIAPTAADAAGGPGSAPSGTPLTSCFLVNSVNSPVPSGKPIQFQSRGVTGQWRTVATVTADGHGCATAAVAPGTYRSVMTWRESNPNFVLTWRGLSGWTKTAQHTATVTVGTTAAKLPLGYVSPFRQTSRTAG